MLRIISHSAKIAQPRAHKFILRQRLFSLLDGAKNFPCSWICGPPGAGKTTLATSYFERTKTPVIWYQVDPGDADIGTFFFHLSQAAGNLAGHDLSLPKFEPNSTRHLAAFTQTYFRQLFGAFDGPIALVLDDYQTVASDAPIHDVIASAVQSVPAESKIYVLSRLEPPATFARLRANQRISIIDWPALRMSKSEVREVAELYRPGEMSDSDLESLDNKSDGWLAGLVLMLQRPVQASAYQPDVSDNALTVMFDYFAQEVFDQKPHDVQAVLMKAALLPRMTGSVINKLADDRGAERILSELHLNNYFTHCHDLQDPVYQFHPLFRDFLEAQLLTRYDAEHVRFLRSRGAQLLELDGQTVSAIDLYLDSEAYDDAARLIRNFAPALFEQGQIGRLRGWINRLPESTINKSPWTIYWQGLSETYSDPTLSRQILERAFHLFKSSGDWLGICLSWCGIVDSLFIGLYAYEQGQQWIETGEKLIADISGSPTTDIEIRVISSMCYLLCSCQPDHPLLPVLLRRAKRIMANQSDSKNRLILGGVLMHFYGWRFGNIEVGPLIRDMTRQSGSSELDVSWRSFAYALQAVMYAMGGRQEKALVSVREGLAYSETHQVTAFRFNLISHGAWAALVSGNPEQGMKYAEMLRSMGMEGLVSTLYHFLLAWKSWSAGQYENALKDMEISFRDIENSDYAYGRAMMRAMLAAIQIDAGKLIEGRQNLREAMSAGAIGPSNWILFNGCFIDANDKLNQGQLDECLDVLRQAFRIGRENQLYATFLWSPSRMSRLCALALEHDIEVEHVQEMIRRNALVPDPAAAALHNWPWPVKVSVLGPFRLEVDGEQIGAGHNGQQKITELLKAIVIFGSTDVSVARLKDALWPDSDGDHASSALKTSLHRLRKLLGRSEAIEVSAGHVSINPAFCWSDLRCFEDISREAQADAASPDSLERALDLYRGPLLSSEEQPLWVIAPSERVRSEFLRDTSLLGQKWELEQEWHRAIEVYERALAVDCLVETFYEHLILCHQNLGQNAEALSVYERCSHVLAAELGIDPSTKLQAIHQDLQRH